MTHYSPAPWKQIEDDEGNVIVKMDEAHSVVIANLEGSCQTCHANADLIEAAPKLLMACHNALGAYEALKLNDIDKYLPGYDSCLTYLKNAIAQAERR